MAAALDDGALDPILEAADPVVDDPMDTVLQWIGFETKQLVNVSETKVSVPLTTSRR